MPALLASTEADLPFVRAVAGQLERLFGVPCAAELAGPELPDGSLLLERMGTTRRRRRSTFQLDARFHAHGPLAQPPFKFRLSVSSTTDDLLGDEAALAISVAGQLLPFFAPHKATRPAPGRLVVVARDCGAAFAEQVAEALRYERFEVEVRDEAPADGDWFAPGPLSSTGQLKHASLSLNRHEERWSALKAAGDELLQKLCEKFSERARELRRKP